MLFGLRRSGRREDRLFRLELGPGTKVIGTGGPAELIAGETSVIEVVAPALTLEGAGMFLGIQPAISPPALAGRPRCRGTFPAI